MDMQCQREWQPDLTTTSVADSGGTGKRCGYFFGTLDAYINVVGGMKLDEPAADLPIALSLVSNLTDKVIPDDLVAFGEIGLAGGDARGQPRAGAGKGSTAAGL